jgi:hypothetical protein
MHLIRDMGLFENDVYKSQFFIFLEIFMKTEENTNEKKFHKFPKFMSRLL